MDSGKDVSFDPKEMRHFDHGYAVTSHSSQGLTSQRVLVNMDTEVHPELINARFAYVSVSRASHEAQVFTNDALNLAERLNTEVSKTSALDIRPGDAATLKTGLSEAVSVQRAAGIGLQLSR
jgi:ATP-dependent exoDNAse (exonuclease V) alpha subunit